MGGGLRDGTQEVWGSLTPGVEGGPWGSLAPSHKVWGNLIPPDGGMVGGPFPLGQRGLVVP